MQVVQKRRAELACRVCNGQRARRRQAGECPEAQGLHVDGGGAARSAGHRHSTSVGGGALDIHVRIRVRAAVGVDLARAVVSHRRHDKVGEDLVDRS